MTTISMSSTAKDPDEVITELRKLAEFIEGLAAVENAKVTVTGELNLVVDYRRDENPEPCDHVLRHPDRAPDVCDLRKGHPGPHSWESLVADAS